MSLESQIKLQTLVKWLEDNQHIFIQEKLSITFNISGQSIKPQIIFFPETIQQRQENEATNHS